MYTVYAYVGFIIRNIISLHGMNNVTADSHVCRSDFYDNY
jgi:hypothetical protein